MYRRFLVLAAVLAAVCAATTASADRRTRYVPLNFYEIAQHYKQSVSLVTSMRHEHMSAFYSWINLNVNTKLASFVEKHSGAINDSMGKNGVKVAAARAPFPMPNVTSSCALQLAEFLGALTTKQYWALQLLDSFGKPPAGVLEGLYLGWPASKHRRDGLTCILAR